MPDDTALRMLTLGLNDTHGERGGARGNQRVRRGRGIHIRVQSDFEIHPFRTVLLHEVSLGECLLHVGRKLQPVARTPGSQPDARQHRPGFIDVLTQVGLRVGSRIGRNHVEATCEILCGPAGTNDSRPNNGNTADGFVKAHDCFSVEVISA